MIEKVHGVLKGKRHTSGVRINTPQFIYRYYLMFVTKQILTFIKIKISNSIRYSIKYHNSRYTYRMSPTEKIVIIAALAQWIKALAPQAEGWVFETQPRQT